MAPNSGPVGSITSLQGQGYPIVAELRDVSKSYGAGNNRVLALDRLSLKVRQGDYLAVMGASGSGKSTAMNILGCLDQPSSGEYWLENDRTGGLNDDQLAGLRNRKLGFVFQQFYLLRELTALENVMLPMVYAGVSRPLQRQWAEEALVRVGLGERLHNRPNQLSGGQQQRVAIARAIINRPVLLLADEPTGALDSTTSHEVMDLFGELHQAGMTVILVTHEQEVAARAKTTLHFADGRLQETATPASPSPATPALRHDGNSPSPAAVPSPSSSQDPVPPILPGSSVTVQDSCSIYRGYTGIVQRISDRRAAVLFEGGNWDKLVTLDLSQLRLP